MFDISIILSTFDSPEWLEKVLWGYAAQTYSRFEIVVADDGSAARTALLIARMRKWTGLEIRHVWQEHHGFRKCRILNRAIVAAEGNYLLFSDGDCIPRRDFVARHAELAEPGRFLSGGIVRLPQSVSEQITANEIVNGKAFQIDWLRARGMPSSHKLRHLITTPWLVWTLNCLSLTRSTFNGHNTSAWREDVLRVNGFDERMSYGGLDRELGERLVNAGVRPKRVRHLTTCLHLHHERGYVQSEALAFNRRLREQTRNQRHIWTEYGILSHSDVVTEIVNPAQLYDEPVLQRAA